MSICRVNKKARSGFTQLDNALINDTSLSFRALGVLTYLLSKPHNWQVRIAELSGKREEGRDAVRTAIQELMAARYVCRDRARGPGGKMEGYIYNVFEEPLPPGDGFPGDGLPGDGKPADGFPPPTNTEYKKTDSIKKEKTKTPVVPQGGPSISSSPGSAPEEPTSHATIPESSAFPKIGNRVDYAAALQLYDPRAAAAIAALFPGMAWQRKTARQWLRCRRENDLSDQDIAMFTRYFRDAVDLTEQNPSWKPRNITELTSNCQTIRDVVRRFAQFVDPSYMENLPQL